MAKSAKSEFAKRLKAANKNWASAKEKAAEKDGGGFTEFDDGRYMARLKGGKLGESESGRLQIAFAFEIQEGEHEGKTKYDYQGVESEQNLEYLGRRLTQLGYELPDDLDQIEDILEDIGKTKPLCKIRLKSKGDFQNVYIDKVFSSDEDEESDEDETEETEVENTDADEAEEEEEAPPPTKKAKAKAVPEPEPEEDEDEDEAEEESEDDEAEEVEEAGDDEAEEVELSKGMNVIADTAKGEMRATVIEILEKEGKARVKLEDDRVIRIDVAKLSMADDVPEEPAVAPKKKTKK